MIKRCCRLYRTCIFDVYMLSRFVSHTDKGLTASDRQLVIDVCALLGRAYNQDFNTFVKENR